jgi:hypothetical protein
MALGRTHTTIFKVAGYVFTLIIYNNWFCSSYIVYLSKQSRKKSRVVKENADQQLSAPIFILWLKGAMNLGVASKRSCYTSMSNWTYRAWSSTGDVKFCEPLIVEDKSSISFILIMVSLYLQGWIWYACVCSYDYYYNF